MNIGLSAACLLDLWSFTITPSAVLNISSNNPFLQDTTTLRLKPGLEASWNLVDGFIVEATTDIIDVSQQITVNNQGSAKGFWIRYESNTNQHWKGMPSLENIALGALDIALGFVQNVTKVQDWLATPLLYPTPNLPEWYDGQNSHQDMLDALRLVSRPGSIAAALELMDGGNGTGGYEPDYVFKSASSIRTTLTSWKSDPLAQF